MESCCGGTRLAYNDSDNSLELCFSCVGVPVFMVGFEVWKQVVALGRVESFK